MGKSLGENAAVIGGSIAGLMTARVLADHFEQVVVLERDHIAEEPAVHKSIPQGNHLHALLLSGQQLLSEAALQRFFRVIQDCGDVQHEIMLKFLFYTAVRVSELVGIRVENVDLEQCKVFIGQGKGAKDRYILFPSSFRLVLKSHLQAHPQNRYLFESQRNSRFTARRIQQLVQGYRLRAGITQAVHPHLFRHQMITWLTSHGLSDAQIQLISGHESKKSLEVYQHLALNTVEHAYQEAVRSISL